MAKCNQLTSLPFKGLKFGAMQSFQIPVYTMKPQLPDSTYSFSDKQRHVGLAIHVAV